MKGTDQPLAVIDRRQLPHLDVDHVSCELIVLHISTSLMAELDCGCLPVGEEGRLVGSLV